MKARNFKCCGEWMENVSLGTTDGIEVNQHMCFTCKKIITIPQKDLIVGDHYLANHRFLRGQHGEAPQTIILGGKQ